ncbi:MAG: S8 family serine peptidase, partial [Xanthomonadales bacterium]|nr:S8 family serine peptidase [Xanthomonadales bacterium]
AKTREQSLRGLGVSKAGRQALLPGGFGVSAEQRARWQAIEAIKALQARADVRYAEANGIARPAAVPNDPGYPLQWHYPQINLPAAWDVTTGSNNVVVAVIDTGVSPHTDMAGKIRTDLGADLIANALNACDGDGPDFDATDPGDGQGCGGQGSSSFHGTHVAGTVAAATNNGVGVSGVSWGSSIMPVRVLGREGGTTFDIANGIRWAGGGGALGAAPPRGADVLNLSIQGQSECPQVYLDAISDARGRGSVIVAAAGNFNSTLPFTPGNCPGIINVAALDRGNQPASYSNCSPTIAVGAPGGETSPEVPGSTLFPPQNGNACKAFSGGFARPEDGVLSTLGPGLVEPEQYAYYNGTSMAAPHMAGVVALMKSVHPGLTPDQVDSLLASGRITQDVAGNGATTRDPFTGYGLIDAFRAVSEARLLAGGGGTPPALLLQPGNLVFGETTSQLAFRIEAAGTGPLVVTGISSSVPWLGVSGGGANGLGDYVASVDRNGLPAGDYNGQLRVDSNVAGSATIAVILRVGAPPAVNSGAVGQIYVALVDPITGLPLRFAAASGGAGEQPYVFDNLRAGRYAIVAGTDNDNDGAICDPGEACGLFPDFNSFDAFDLSPGDSLPAFLVPADSNGIGAGGSSASLQTPRQLREVRRAR